MAEKIYSEGQTVFIRPDLRDAEEFRVPDISISERKLRIAQSGGPHEITRTGDVGPNNYYTLVDEWFHESWLLPAYKTKSELEEAWVEGKVTDGQYLEMLTMIGGE